MKKALVGIAASTAVLFGLAWGARAGDEHGHGGMATPTPAAQEQGPKEVTEVRCPVLGEVVQNTAEAPKSEYKGKTYYFCCAPCKVQFDQDPEKYLNPQK